MKAFSQGLGLLSQKELNRWGSEETVGQSGCQQMRQMLKEGMDFKVQG